MSKFIFQLLALFCLINLQSFSQGYSTEWGSEGISKEGEIIDIGVQLGIIDKSGAWYSYNGDRIGQGKDNSREFLREHPELANEIDAKIRANAKGNLDAVVKTIGPDDAAD